LKVPPFLGVAVLRSAFLAPLFSSAVVLPRGPTRACQEPVVPVAVTYDHAGTLDEDDMCYWVHPSDPALSTVIVTDKFAGKILVYDLDGRLLQELPSPSPRNVDTRYSVPFHRTCIDLVALTDRTEDIIRVYRVDPATRALVRIDDGKIHTQDNYGFTLYQQADGQLLGITGDRDTGLMRQFALFENGLGQMSGTETAWTFHETRVEGVVADDETGYYYLAEEEVGIWRVGALDSGDRTLIARVGDATGLQGDIEGLALYYAANGEGYLIASSQGDNKFTVIDRKPPHRGRGNFRVQGVRATDGLDVLNMNLNGTYSKGIFSVHNGGSNCCSIHGVRWADIASALGLVVDTGYWDPRIPCRPLEDLQNAVVIEEVHGGASSSSGRVATDDAVSAGAGDLYVAAVSLRGGSVSVRTVSGLGLSWTFLARQCTGRGLSAIETWTAQGVPSGDGPVAATLSSAPLAAVIAVTRYSNVRNDPIRGVVSRNTNGSAGACSGGTESGSYALDVTATSEGSFLYGAVTMRHREHAPGERYRERVERRVGATGNVASVAVVDRLITQPGTIPWHGTFSGATDWAAIGFEILPRNPSFDEYGQGPIHLSGSGAARSGGPSFTLEMTGAAPLARGALVLSLSSTDVPGPDSAVVYVAPPIRMRVPLSFDDRGRASLSASVPPGVPAFVAYLQAYTVGTTIEHSNGLRVSVQPGGR
jgi:3-phytase